MNILSPDSGITFSLCSSVTPVNITLGLEWSVFLSDGELVRVVSNFLLLFPLGVPAGALPTEGNDSDIDCRVYLVILFDKFC